MAPSLRAQCPAPISGTGRGLMPPCTHRDCLDLSHASSTQGNGERQQRPILNTSCSCTTPPKSSRAPHSCCVCLLHSGEGAGEQHRLRRSEAVPRIRPCPQPPVTIEPSNALGWKGPERSSMTKVTQHPEIPCFPAPMRLPSHEDAGALSSPSRHTQN